MPGYCQWRADQSKGTLRVMASAQMLMMAIVVALKKHITSQPIALWLGNESSPAQVLPWPPATRPEHDIEKRALAVHLPREFVPADEMRWRTAVDVHKPGPPGLSSKVRNLFQARTHSHWKRKSARKAPAREERSNDSEAPRPHSKRRPLDTTPGEGGAAKMPGCKLEQATAQRITPYTIQKSEETGQNTKQKKINLASMTTRHQGHGRRNVVTRYATQRSVGHLWIESHKKPTLTIRGNQVRGKRRGSHSGVSNHSTKPPRTHRKEATHKRPTLTTGCGKSDCSHHGHLVSSTTTPPRTHQNEGSHKKSTLTIRGHEERGKSDYSHHGGVTKTASKPPTIQRRKEPHTKATLPSTSPDTTSRSGLAEGKHLDNSVGERKQRRKVNANNKEPEDRRPQHIHSQGNAGKIGRVKPHMAAKASTAKEFAVERNTTPRLTGSYTNLKTQRKRPITAVQQDMSRAFTAATLKQATITKLPPISGHHKRPEQERESTNLPVSGHDSTGASSPPTRIQHPNNHSLKPARSKDLLQQTTQRGKWTLGRSSQSSHFQVAASARSTKGSRQTDEFQRIRTKPSKGRRLHMTTHLPSLLTVKNHAASAKGTVKMNTRKAMAAKTRRGSPRKLFKPRRPTNTSQRHVPKTDRPKWRRRQYQRKRRPHRSRHRKTHLREMSLQDKQRRLSNRPPGRSPLSHGGKEWHKKQEARSPAKAKEESKGKRSSTTDPKEQKGETFPVRKPPDSSEMPRKQESSEQRQ